MLSPRRLLAVALLAELVALYLLLDRGGWAFDDNLQLVLARAGGFSRHWLTSNLFGHFEPAHRAIVLLQAHLMPFSYRWALLAMLVALGASALLLERICALLIGDGYVPALAAIYLGISVLWISPLQWWTPGLETFPTLLLGLISIWAYLRYQTDRRARWIVVSAGTVAAGLLFYEKPVFLPLYLLLLRILILGGKRSPRRITAAIWEERSIWLAYAGVVVGYVIVRESVGAGSIGSHGGGSLGQWASFYRVLWLNTLVPALFGLRTPASGLSGIQVLAVVACQLLLAAIIIGSLARRPRLWPGWVTLALCFVVTGVLVGAGRLADLGPSVANDRRYLVDFAWLVPMMLCAAAGAGRRSPTERNASTTRPPRARVAVSVAVATTVYAYASIATGAKLEHDWKGLQAGAWEKHASTELAAIRRSGATPVVANSVVPFYIIGSVFPPYDELSYVLPIYSAAGHVDGPLDGPLFRVDDNGHLHRAHLVTVSSRRGRGRCLGPEAAARSVPTRIPATAHIGGRAFVRVSYTSPRRETVPLTVKGWSDSSAPPDRRVALDAGRHQSIAWLGRWIPRRIDLKLPDGSGVCVWGVEVVALRGGV